MSAPSPAGKPLAGFVGRLLAPFSSITFGIVLLAILFVYMSIGSAGIVYPVHPNIFHPDAWVHAQLRQWRPFEMTEFEWFHWWPFDLLLGLIAATVITTTLRRVPLKPAHFGTWLVHGGVLLLMAGSVWYFGTKVEGDAPVIRRRVVLALAGEAQTADLMAMPGATAAIGAGDKRYEVRVMEIDPAWELLTGDARGQRALSVQVLVQGPKEQFIRQLIGGHPELTEDLIFTGDHKQPVQRARKVLGKAMVDETLSLRLDYQPAEWFYLRNDLSPSFALYVREAGTKEWAMRPIAGMPFYNDSFPSAESVFQSTSQAAIEPHQLRLSAPAQSAADPFPETDFRISGYLRYAQMRSTFRAGTETAPLYPVARLAVGAGDGAQQSYTLEAFDPQHNSAESGMLRFSWIDREDDLQRFLRPAQLVFAIPGSSVELAVDVPAAAEEFSPISPQAPGYSFRVAAIEDDISVGGKRFNVALIDLCTPQGQFRRWVFDDPALTRDAPVEGSDPAAHTGGGVADESISVGFVPGRPAALLNVIGGPEPDRLRLAIALPQTPARVEPIAVGQILQLPAGIGLSVESLMPRAVADQRPFIVPLAQRNRDAAEMLSMALVAAGDAPPRWLNYHPYANEDAAHNLRGLPFAPSAFRLADGRTAEVMFSRQRLPLPAPVALEEFVLTTHMGGYTGDATTIRNYTSMLRFAAGDSWSEPVAVSVNEPVEYDGFWYFQAQWDPPDPGDGAGTASAGMNYTVLGVANRRGVGLQLAGCIVAVLGMIYAFTVKPIIRRRRVGAASGSAGGSGAASIGSAVAIALVAMLIPTSSARADDFASEVDLSPLAGVAVQTDGRIKSFGSFAHSTMSLVSGPRRIDGQSPEFTYLDMLLRPDAYRDADVVFVKAPLIRARIAEALMQADATLGERMDAFQSSGLISPALLIRPQLAPTLREMAADLLRTGPAIEQVMGAASVMRPESLLGRLKIVPPGKESLSAPWHGVSEIMLLAADPAAVAQAGLKSEPLAGVPDAAQRDASTAWREMVEGWAAGDAAKVNAAVAALAPGLVACADGAYPDGERLRWESWYFQNGNLTRLWLVYLLAIVVLLPAVVYRWRWARFAGLGVFGVALALHTGAVMLRWWIAQRWPNSNMFEAVTTSVWFGAIAAAALEIWLRRRESAGLFAIAASVACMVALMAAHFLPVQLNPAIGNMMPVLHDVWLYIHTNVVIFSYALIFMAAVAALGYLVYRLTGGEAVYARAGGAGAVFASRGAKIGEVLDGVTMLLMQLSFVMLWSGIVMGAIWADHSWGRPWGWDPKEVFALNTFVVFALLIHVRLRVKDKGLWTAVLAVIGAGVMLFNWIVINFVITGLHSYA